MTRGFLISFSYLFIPVLLYASEVGSKNEERELRVACTAINGRINNPSKCNELQMKALQRRCNEMKDPNACKALEVASKGVDIEGEKLIKQKEKEKKKTEEDNKKGEKVWNAMLDQLIEKPGYY